MLATVQIQHELRQCAMQAGQLPTQHGEARTRQLGGGFAIQPAMACAQFHVILDLKVEHTRAAPAVLLNIAMFITAGRHRCIRQIGDARRDRFDLAANALQLHFRSLQLFTKAGHLGHHRRHILALGFEHADLLAAGIAQVLQFLGADLNLLAAGLQRLQCRHIQLETARGAQAVGKLGRVGTQQIGIKHGRGQDGQGMPIIA